MRQLLAYVAEKSLAHRMRLVATDNNQVGFDLHCFVQDPRTDGVGIGAIDLRNRGHPEPGQAVCNLAAEGVSLRDGLRFYDLLWKYSPLPEVEYRHGGGKRLTQCGDHLQQLIGVLVLVDRDEDVLEQRTYLTSSGTVTEPIPSSTTMAAPTTSSRTRSLVK